MADHAQTPVLIDRPSPGCAVVTLNRPEKLNALSPGLLADLGRALDELAADPDLRALVLTGAGKAFCAGLDLGELGVDADFGLTQMRPLVEFPHPVIGAINGVAVTGGLEIALQCDFRIASSNARFADTHGHVGVVPGWGLTARLPQAIGQSWARQMSFSGDFVDAATALRIGLVNEVVEAGGLLSRCEQLAASIAATNRPTVATVREIYNASRDQTGATALTMEAEHAADGFTMDDPGSFAERRAQVFERGRSQ